RQVATRWSRIFSHRHLQLHNCMDKQLKKPKPAPRCTIFLTTALLFNSFINFHTNQLRLVSCSSNLFAGGRG
ncbi:unnamed protein product, partial [Amoebophrya sp. A120]